MLWQQVLRCGWLGFCEETQVSSMIPFEPLPCPSPSRCAPPPLPLHRPRAGGVGGGASLAHFPQTTSTLKPVGHNSKHPGERCQASWGRGATVIW